MNDPAPAAGEPMSKTQQKRLQKEAERAAAKAEKEKAKAAQNPEPAKDKKPATAEEELSPEMYLERRRAHIDETMKSGGNPYPHKFKVTTSIPGYVSQWEGKMTPGERREGEKVSVAGRVMLRRSAGAKLHFYTVQGEGKDVQVIADAKHGSGYDFDGLNAAVKRGDVVGFHGFAGTSNKGELSVYAEDIVILTPCLRLLPDKHHGVKDLEVRYRQRYLDMMYNLEVRETFILRSKIVSGLRRFLDDRGFTEVETPMMAMLTGGASAKPFETYHNDLDLKLFLRIAPELYLKQCVIGGLDRVYEIGKNFRNEGIDMTHNPEFTGLEFYMAYADVYDLMDMTEELLSELVLKLKGTHKTLYHKEGKDKAPLEINWAPPYRRVNMIEELERKLGEPLPCPTTFDTPEAVVTLKALCDKHNVKCSPPQTAARLIDKLVGHFIEPDCISPTFLCEQPVIMSPLAKPHRSKPGLTERFELFAAGMEVCNSYTELNNPLLQRQRFMEQMAAKDQGDDEAQDFDEGFVTALEYGLPPTGGWGIGIDRLTMFLSDHNTIKEVLLFPAMKPQDK